MSSKMGNSFKVYHENGSEEAMKLGKGAMTILKVWCGHILTFEGMK